MLAETHILGSLTQTYVYVQNHRGDTVALVDGASGTVAGRYDYDAWGNPQTQTPNPSVVPFFTFSGKHWDADAGLYYYGFRWYDPIAKRWTQPDPSGLKEGLDLYRFCGNDPVNGVDVDGRAVFVTHVVYVGGQAVFVEKAFPFNKGSEIKAYIKTLPDKSIVGFTVAGHAEPERYAIASQTIWRRSTDWTFLWGTEHQDLEALRLEDDGSFEFQWVVPVSSFASESKDAKGVVFIRKSIGFGSLLSEKLCDGAQIILNGCSTENFARDLSHIFPSSFVFGTTEDSDPVNPQTLAEEGVRAWYHNGEKIKEEDYHKYGLF